MEKCREKRLLRLIDLRQKEVINERDCRCLGCVADIEFEAESGCVCALIIPGQPKMCGLFGRDSEYVIPFHMVKQIGEDIILVCVNEEEVLVRCKG